MVVHGSVVEIENHICIHLQMGVSIRTSKWFRHSFSVGIMEKNQKH